MKNLFERTSSNWVRYSEYEWKAAADGTMILTSHKTAQPVSMTRWQRISSCSGCHQYRVHGVSKEIRH